MGLRPKPTERDKPQMNVTLTLPDWLTAWNTDHGSTMVETDADAARLAIELARLNVQHGTGGPFGAVVVDLDHRTLLSAGANLVVANHCSLWHAEMVAIALAQNTLGQFDLSAAGRFALATSAEPCAMCFGAIPWAGIQRLICSARDADVRAIGFDEGAKLKAWAGALENRGIAVVRDARRDEAIEVLTRYAHGGGAIYNGGNH